MLPWGGLIDAQSRSLLAPRDMPKPFQMRFRTAPALRPIGKTMTPDGPVDLFSVIERPAVVRILPNGLKTTFWGYNGLVPGPTIHATMGRPLVLRVRNHLPARNPLLGYEAKTSTHLHGSPSLPQYDGYASDVSRPGFYKEYHYPNTDGPVTLWYHDHAVHHTAENAYFGLAGQYLIHDAFERRMLPQGEFDIPLTVRDVQFGPTGELGFDSSSDTGLMGDVILANGVPWPVMKVKRRIYRFRMLTAAISRSFRFLLNNGDPMVVVGTDGGFMPKPQTVSEWRQGVAERYEVLIDFARYKPGERVILRNLSNPNNVDFADTDLVMAFDVTDEPFDHSDPTWNTIPAEMPTSACMDLKPSQAKRTRTFVFEHEGDQWKINGKTWEDVIASDFQFCLARPGFNDVEIWEFTNPGGGWFHPVHIHLLEFKILERNGKPPFDFELGPKDVVYTGEGETVKLIMRFGPNRGRYMIHCHNLVHEDHDMMGQFGVGFTPGARDPNDPMTAAPPKVDNLPPDP